MGHFVGVDWAGKRWIVTNDSENTIEVEAQPSFQAVWEKHSSADQILVDIPIGLPETAENSPRTCDVDARDIVAGSQFSSIFDVPSRGAVQTSDHETALQRNIDQIGDDSLGPQKWGFAERIHEVDVFMRNTNTDGDIRESHPEVCFAGLSPEEFTGTSKKTEPGEIDRLDILEIHDSRFAETFHRVRNEIESKPAWKRRIGIGMRDDILDAMVLALTARLGSNNEFSVLGGDTDEKGLPMEIVYYEAK